MAGAVDTHKGTVMWFDGRKGWGFITPEDGGDNLFVHYTSIKAVGYRSLEAGEAVEFVVSVGDDGRKSAISVTGPGGAYVKSTRYFCGACYRCGEVGHMAMDCKSNIGPCYSCGVMGHLARECSATQLKTYSPIPKILKSSNLGSILPHSPPMTLPSYFMKSMDSEEEEEEEEIEEEEEETDEEDQEFPRWVEGANWAELPHDVLWVIFKKIAALEIIRSAQFVCRPWRKLSHEPELWRCIDITMPDERMEMGDLKSMAMSAVDRSQGCLKEFYLECYGSECDELMCYISDRAINLQRLRLISIHGMSEMALVQAVKKFPLLEEFEISFCFFSAEVVELVGLACPQLKNFKLNAQPYMDQYDYDSSSDENFDVEALAIAMHMPQLHRLQLIGNSLTNIGLLAILNNCPNLKYLDIRGCLNVDIDENLKKKCAKIKDMKFPKDSTEDYEFNALIVGLEAFDDDFDPTLYDFYYSHSDYDHYDGYSDMSYDDLFEFC